MLISFDFESGIGCGISPSMMKGINRGVPKNHRGWHILPAVALPHELILRQEPAMSGCPRECWVPKKIMVSARVLNFPPKADSRSVKRLRSEDAKLRSMGTLQLKSTNILEIVSSHSFKLVADQGS